LLQSEKGQQLQQEPQSSQKRIRVALALVALLLISGCVVFQAGEFTAAKLRSNEAFAGANVVLPGDRQANKNELWVQGTSAVDSPYKMVFVNGDIWLYAKSDCPTKTCTWNKMYTNIADPATNWGTPYWKLSTVVQNYITAKPPGSNTKFPNGNLYDSKTGLGVIFNAQLPNGAIVGLVAAVPYTWTDYVNTVASGKNTIADAALAYSAGTKTAANLAAKVFDNKNQYGWLTIYSGTTPVFQFRSNQNVIANSKSLQFIIGTDGNLQLLGGPNTMFFTGKYIAASGSQPAHAEYFY